MAKKDTMPAVIDFWNKVADEFDSIYTGQNKSGVARWMDGFFRKDIYERREWTLAHAGDLKGRSIIDIGCGPGRFCSDFARAGSPRVVGLDTAPEMLRRAREVVAAEKTAAVCEWVCSDILDWHQNEVFDVSVAMGFWDYVEDPRSRLTAIRKVTRDRFLSSWPRLWTWRSPLRKVRLQYIRGCPVYFFTRSQLEQMFTATGWKIVSCEVIGKIYCVDARPV
jgi:SAM-dependent methyltransferase